MRNVQTENSFDAVIIPESIDYMSSPEEINKTFFNAKRFLKQGGLLLVVACKTILKTDNKKIIKVSLYIIGGISATVLGLFGALWIISPGKADPVTDLQGNTLEGSISVIEKISLGGLDQNIIIRGADSTKPVILFLHGGPGSPEAAFMKHFNPDIEKDFVMVYWEQCGAGKSYSKNIPAESMNMAQFISDTRELSEYLSERFNQARSNMMAKSFFKSLISEHLKTARSIKTL